MAKTTWRSAGRLTQLLSDCQTTCSHLGGDFPRPIDGTTWLPGSSSFLYLQNRAWSSVTHGRAARATIGLSPRRLIRGVPVQKFICILYIHIYFSLSLSLLPSPGGAQYMGVSGPCTLHKIQNQWTWVYFKYFDHRLSLWGGSGRCRGGLPNNNVTKILLFGCVCVSTSVSSRFHQDRRKTSRRWPTKLVMSWEAVRDV